jgi:uncharacterized Zn-binding protein involved in type VI secretion
MPRATRLNDVDTGHSNCPPTKVNSASGDVIINGLGAARVGDTLEPHCSPPHGRTISAGSSTVFINGKAAVRKGDPIDCGGVIDTSSSDVIVG